jgi:hypothetical protein
MDSASLRSWLDGYRRAWELKDPGAAGALFTDDASYQESPYDKPMRGRAAIVEYWSHVPRTQDNIHFNYEIIAVTDKVAVAHWAASFTRIPSNTKVKLDGIFLLSFNESNHCKSLSEWWVRQES